MILFTFTWCLSVWILKSILVHLNYSNFYQMLHKNSYSWHCNVHILSLSDLIKIREYRIEKKIFFVFYWNHISKETIFINIVHNFIVGDKVNIHAASGMFIIRGKIQLKKYFFPFWLKLFFTCYVKQQEFFGMLLLQELGFPLI